MASPSKTSFLSLLLLPLALCVFTPAGLSLEACRATCTSSTSACRRLHTSELVKCASLYPCSLDKCKRDRQCKHGCDTCKNYWTHYISDCDTKFGVCIVQCATA